MTTVLVPRAATEQSPVIAYQCAIDAVSSRAFPSYGLLPGSSGLNQTQNELLLMVAAFGKGWIVTVSHHGGPDGLFMMARQPGYHVLDGIRATLAGAGDDGIPALGPRTPVGLWGVLRRRHGPRMGRRTRWRLRPRTQCRRRVARRTCRTARPVGAPPQRADRVGSGRPGCDGDDEGTSVSSRISAPHLNRKGLRITEAAERTGIVESMLSWPFTDFGKLVDRPIEELMAEPAIANLTEEMELGQRVPKVHDELLPITGSDYLAERYIAGGAHVTYRRDRLSEHILLCIIWVNDALGWLVARLAGTPLPPDPDVATVVTTSATLRALRVSMRWMVGMAKLLTGRL